MEGTKMCNKCKKIKLFSDFSPDKRGRLGRHSKCKECVNIYNSSVQGREVRNARRRKLRIDSEYVDKERQYEIIRNWKDLRKRLLISAKSRAKKKFLAFNIELEDIVLPKVCPLLGIKLQVNGRKKSGSSYSIDRIENSKGYVKGNIWVISNKANAMKSDSSLEELKLFATNILKLL